MRKIVRVAGPAGIVALVHPPPQPQVTGCQRALKRLRRGVLTPGQFYSCDEGFISLVDLGLTLLVSGGLLSSVVGVSGYLRSQTSDQIMAWQKAYLLWSVNNETFNRNLFGSLVG